MKVKYTNKIIKIKNNITDFKVMSSAIKKHLAKNKLDIIKVLQNENIYVPLCAFCGKPNQHFFLICEMVDDCWFITDIDLTYGGKTDCFYYCWTNKLCPGKKINGNSVEFVSKTRNISEDAALILIHNRNKSPFYKENHDTYDSYVKSQSNYGIHPETDMTYILSDKGYKERYGEQWIEIKKSHNQSKAITLESLQKKYGMEDGEKRHKEWIKNTDIGLETMKRKYGNVKGSMKYMSMIAKFQDYYCEIKTLDDFVDYCLFVLRKNSFYKLNSYPTETILLSKKGVSAGIEYFEIDVKDLILLLKQKDNTINKFDVREGNKTKFGFVYYTPAGKILRSTYELEFYLGLLSIGLTDADLEIDGNYPNHTCRYDFYIKPLSIYVEIAGLMEFPWYDEKMKMKANTFDAIIIEPDKIAETIKMIGNCYDK